jgi:predicted TIM-barrel fold metal-dependent hydrolase
MHLLDAHTHLPLDTQEAKQWWIDRNASILNICVASDELGGLDAQRSWYRQMRSESERFAWVTSFSLDEFGSDGFASRAIAQIEEDVRVGKACGVKVWKNIGMEKRDPHTGEFVFLDDARFAPIFEWMQENGVPLLAHMAEPIAAWLPLDESSPHYGYYKTATQWHWYGRSDVPTHDRLIASRDAVVERYPKLTFVGLHLGSQEHDLNAVSERLKKWPNYFVDTAARLGDLVLNASKDRDGVRALFVEHVDRIIWGTDPVITQPISGLAPEKKADLLNYLQWRMDIEWRFFATDEVVKFGPNHVRGLALSSAHLEKLMYTNARQLYQI